MIIVGLTGGIGSGKTTVANLFSKQHNIPIYIADVEAKALMNRSKVIKRKLIKLFGSEAYINNALNRPFLASKIFSDKELLTKMNHIGITNIFSINTFHQKCMIQRCRSKPYEHQWKLINFDGANRSMLKLQKAPKPLAR